MESWGITEDSIRGTLDKRSNHPPPLFSFRIILTCWSIHNSTVVLNKTNDTWGFTSVLSLSLTQIRSVHTKRRIQMIKDRDLYRNKGCFLLFFFPLPSHDLGFAWASRVLSTLETCDQCKRMCLPPADSFVEGDVDWMTGFDRYCPFVSKREGSYMT
jgi:hypothetical protein